MMRAVVDWGNAEERSASEFLGAWQSMLMRIGLIAANLYVLAHIAWAALLLWNGLRLWF